MFHKICFWRSYPFAEAQFNRKKFGLSFGLKNHLSFGLRFPTLRKCSKMGSLDTSQNKNRISIRFSSQNSSQIFFYWIGPQGEPGHWRRRVGRPYERPRHGQRQRVQRREKRLRQHDQIVWEGGAGNGRLRRVPAKVQQMHRALNNSILLDFYSSYVNLLNGDKIKWSSKLLSTQYSHNSSFLKIQLQTNNSWLGIHSFDNLRWVVVLLTWHLWIY